MGEPAPLVEHFFRREYGRVVATLVRRFGAERLELIEDCVQSAMALALTSWSLRGRPDNPGAWLTRTARNALLDHLRREGIGRRVMDALPKDEVEPQADDPTMTEEVGDDALRMLFVVADPGLPQEQQLALALKILCGFSVREISARLFVAEEALRKRLQRGRKALAALSPNLDGPSPEAFAERLQSVQRIVYLLFNEGYSSIKENEHLRLELCEEALRLCRMLLAHPRGAVGSTWALLALMTLHHARRDARHDDDGAVLLLEEQPRERWHWPEIREAIGYLHRAGEGPEVGRYHVEAAILTEHCSASTYAQTNWVDIVRLYDVLIRLNPSPLHRLNRAVAVAEAQGMEAPFDTGPQAALDYLQQEAPPTWLARHYLWDATLGELHRRLGDHDAARRYLESALGNAPTRAEAQRLRRRLSEVAV